MSIFIKKNIPLAVQQQGNSGALAAREPLGWGDLSGGL